MAGCNVDCHAHIIDQRRFPVPPGRAYKPKPDESGTSEGPAATLDAHSIARFPCGELHVMGARAAPTSDDVHGETMAMTFLETSIPSR
jgi:hypothetical protein